MKSHDITCLQETHFSRRSVSSVRKFCIKHGFILFAGAHSQSTGGVGILIRADFLQTNSQYAEWEELQLGRLGHLKCVGKNGNLSILCAHLFPATDVDRIELLTKLRSSLDSNVNSVIVGDFNFVEYKSDRMYYDVESPYRETDTKIRDFFWDTFAEFEDVSQSASYTQFGPEHSAKLDRIYIRKARTSLSSFFAFLVT
jgi:endonuclease/exonuclease/phosphatase family metal-dependent hydrolase